MTAPRGTVRMNGKTVAADPQLREAGIRAAATVNAYYSRVDWSELSRKFLAIRLADGSTDGTLYDSKRDAVKHVSDERWFAYLAFRDLGPQGATPRDMAIFLQWNRDAYAAGHTLPDPDHRYGGTEAIMTAARGDMYTDIVSRKIQTYDWDDVARLRAALDLTADVR